MSAATIDDSYIRAHFALMAEGDYAQFFAKVAPTVDWTVMGSHALSGRYHSIEEFQRATFARLNPRMTAPLALRVADVVSSGDRAAVELQYCWVIHYNDEGKMDTVHAYLDGELVNQAINENPGP